jgi:fructose-1,6-bisphosphatase I
LLRANYFLNTYSSAAATGHLVELDFFTSYYIEPLTHCTPYLNRTSMHLQILLILVLFAAANALRSLLPKTNSVLQAVTSGTNRKPILPVFDGTCESTGITLSRFMIETTIANPELRDLESLIMSVQTACKTISSVIERASITGITGLEGVVNVQGEDQKKLDVITNEILKKALRYSGQVGVLASEEEHAPINVDKDSFKYKTRGDENLQTTQFNNDVLTEVGGKYVAVFDPLDGSSNVDAGIINNISFVISLVI